MSVCSGTMYIMAAIAILRAVYVFIRHKSVRKNWGLAWLGLAWFFWFFAISTNEDMYPNGLYIYYGDAVRDLLFFSTRAFGPTAVLLSINCILYKE